ncbi:PIN domain-containing protein, partial [Gemmatimonadota bacterium]
SLEDNQVLAAAQLLLRLKEHPLRTLDALHLAACIGTGGEEIATADRVMAVAADALGLQVVRFD